MPDTIWLLICCGIGTIAFFVGYCTGNRFGYDEGLRNGRREAWTYDGIDRLYQDVMREGDE